MNAAEKLAKGIITNYNNQLQSSTIDLPAHVESLLQSLGATTSDSGGKVTYYGSDPITPDRLPYGSISAISLAAKAILIAKIWKERTGEAQDIHVDVRKALRRLTPFLDGKWELVKSIPRTHGSVQPLCFRRSGYRSYQGWQVDHACRCISGFTPARARSS